MKYLLIPIFAVLVLSIGCSPELKRGVSTPRFRHNTDRKITYTADVTLKVSNADSLNRRLTAIAEQLNGYLTSIGNRESVLRIPSEQLENSLTQIAKLGKVTNKIVYSRDVTDEYYDHDIRLQNAEKARQRYLELLSKAESVEATLKVEKELERLNAEIDVLKGKQARLSNQVEYATVNVTIQEKEKLGILGHVVVGVYKGVRWLFVRGR